MYDEMALRKASKILHIPEGTPLDDETRMLLIQWVNQRKYNRHNHG